MKSKPSPSIPQELVDALPPVLWRTDSRLKELTGLTRRSLANLDSLGQGPDERVCHGSSKVGYPRESLIRWLESRMTMETRPGHRA